MVVLLLFAFTIINQSVAVKPEQPVIHNGKAPPHTEKSSGKLQPQISFPIHVSSSPTKPTPNPKKNDHQAQSNDRVYKVDVVSQPANWTYYLYVGLTGLGVIGGLLGLRIIWLQTKATQEAANAARLNAQAVVNSERPWVVVEVEEHPSRDGRYVFRAVNKGRTPAEIVSVDAGHVFTSDPFELLVPPKYSAPTIAPPRLQPTDSRFEIRTVKPVVVIDQNRKREALNNGREFLCFYGRITYWDVMTKETVKPVLHETCWCYAVNFYNDMLTKDLPFTETGSSEYSRYT